MTKIFKNLLLFFSVVTIVIYFTSCEKYSFIDEIIIPDDPICYYGEIQPIFDAKCVSCHRGSIPPDLRPANSFKVLSEGGYLTPLTAESGLYKDGFASASHSTYATSEEKGIILAWLEQGAHEEIPEEK